MDTADPQSPNPDTKQDVQEPTKTLPAYLQKVRLQRYLRVLAEWVIIILVGWFYAGGVLLDLNPKFLSEAGEHHESATFPILTEIGLNRYGELPMWNPYIMTGFPYMADPLSHFWNPLSTICIKIWGGINGMKVSILLSFILAGLGQWFFAHVFGLRGLSRLWTALLFMLSGGLAFLSDLGWYELLLGAVWFPWCFAALWWALRRRDWTSLVLAAFSIVMTLTTGGGYYPFYLLGSLGILTIVHVLLSAPSKRLMRIGRATCVVLLSAGLLAVVFLPTIHGFPLINRWTGDDREQSYSQPIHYALVNYIVSDITWVGAEILGVPSGWKWFYIGPIALGAALCLAPVALVMQRWRRIPLIVAAILAVGLLAWMANRYTPPLAYIYSLFPFLYTLRFPNRLLIVATSPLMVLAGLGWHNLYRQASRWGSRNADWALSSPTRGRVVNLVFLRWLPHFALVMIMLASLMDVFVINKKFAFSPGQVDPVLTTTLSWLKNYDQSFYYINLGGDNMYWKGATAAYEQEVAVINFDYGRHLVSLDRQMQPNSPFIAFPKYAIAFHDAPITLPPDAYIINNFDGYNVWYYPSSLPAAFSIAPNQLAQNLKISKDMVTELGMRYNGPNQVVVQATPAHPGDQLVVLVSNFPGWELLVDGNPAPLQPVNEYLGAAMLEGEHTYTFRFRPTTFLLGLVVSTITLLIALGMIFFESPLRPRRKTLQS
jgi:hypothetical protein